MKEEIKKSGIAFASVLFAVFAVCMIFTTKTQAATFNPTTLTLNDTWVSGEVSQKGEKDYYKVTLTKAGWLTIGYQGFSIENSCVRILDNDLAFEYVDRNVYTSSAISPITESFTLALDQGTYYVEIYGRNDHTGDYRVKGSFKAANNNVGTTNKDFSTAYNLKRNQLVTGFISEDNEPDFYKIVVPSNQCIKVVYTSWLKRDSHIMIYNGNYEKLHEEHVYRSNPAIYTYEQTLSAGTYYIKIDPYDWGVYTTGTYTLKYIEKVLTKSIKISGATTVAKGKSIQLKATASPASTTDKGVEWSSSDSYVAKVDKNTGRVTGYGVGVAKITATALDGSNVAKTYTIVVKPEKMSKPSLYNYSRRKLQISWSSYSGVSGYQVQYSTNKKFKKAKTKKVSKNSTSKTISKLSKKRYYVRVRAYYKKGKKYY